MALLKPSSLFCHHIQTPATRLKAAGKEERSYTQKPPSTCKVCTKGIKDATLMRRERPAALMTGFAYMEVEVFETLHLHELAEIVKHQSHRITATCRSSGHAKTHKYNGRFDGE
ncbi:regulatory protein [Echinococcus multilocularis]|uniref:Regulatory protein n=1 Tax=Echinococcus multilocularis TaxID=6211 RepID=A0A0S4MMB0_ECHMU|nr:regulatory protein [Echinococcus multilocularis]